MATKKKDRLDVISADKITPVAPPKAAPTAADHDRIVMASRAPDGTPAQFDPEFIGPKDVVEEAAATQLTQQKVSAVDQAARGVTETPGVLASDQQQGSSEPDPVVSKLIKAHETAEKDAKKQAKSEVDSLHKGLGE
jgi:hypothetical protein